MKLSKHSGRISIVLGFLMFWELTPGNAYEIPTHQLLSQTATNKSTLDDYVKSRFSACWHEDGKQVCWGLLAGINATVFDNKSVIRLIMEGAADEDRPAFRSRHHFHNPRKLWNQAGLINCPGCQSSIVWSQDTQVLGGSHSWQNARNSFFQAVTAATEQDRNRHLADTFRSLGHLIHLVQDAANPAHTRDDPHIIRDDLHLWAQHNAGTMIANIGGQGGLPLPIFDISLFNQTSANQYAPIPIARVIDADDGDRSTLSTGYNIGIAEYSSANFYSDDSVFSPNFQFPGTSNLVTQVDPVSNETYLKFTANSGGETDYKVAHISALKLITNEAIAPTDKLLDNAVMLDYSKKLLPRAVSYSIGLIHYFFRGDVFTIGACSNPLASDSSTWYPFQVGPFLSLTGMPNEPAGAGDLRVVVGYKLNGVVSFIISDPVQINFAAITDPVNDSVNVRFHSGIPSNADLIDRWVVFRGQLGGESGAVTVNQLHYGC